MKPHLSIAKAACLLLFLLVSASFAQERGIIGISYTATQWGAQITKVTPGMPADKAGIKVGDVITAVDNHSIAGASTQQINSLIGGPVGTAAILTISTRNSRYQKAVARVPAGGSAAPVKAKGIIGISYSANQWGAQITKVVPGLPADKAGIRVGDIITYANNVNLSGKSLSQITSAIAGVPGSTITLTVNNNRGPRKVTLIRVAASISNSKPFGIVGITWQLNQWGAQITIVTPGGPAAKAGIRVGDTITAINNTRLAGLSIPQIKDLIGGPVGSSVTFTVANRQGTTNLTLIRVSSSTSTTSSNEGIIGISYSAIPAGMLITAVTPNLPVAKAGIRVNDVITSINGRSIAGYSQEKAHAMLVGPAGTRITLGVATTSGPRTITIVKQRR